MGGKVGSTIWCDLLVHHIKLNKLMKKIWCGLVTASDFCYFFVQKPRFQPLAHHAELWPNTHWIMAQHAEMAWNGYKPPNTNSPPHFRPKLSLLPHNYQTLISLLSPLSLSPLYSSLTPRRQINPSSLLSTPPSHHAVRSLLSPLSSLLSCNPKFLFFHDIHTTSYLSSQEKREPKTHKQEL